MFKMDIEFNDDANCVEVKLTGIYPDDNSKINKIYQRISDSCIKHTTSRVVIDYRGAIYLISASQMIENTERIIRYKLTDVFFAVIFDLESESFKNYQLLLIEAETRRVLGTADPKYKVFSNHSDAIDWIKTR